MIIIMYDGSVLECNKIEIYGNELIADDYRIVPIIDVNRIESK